MKFLAVYTEFEDERSQAPAGCTWIEEENLDAAYETAEYLFNNQAAYLVLTHIQAKELAQKVIDSLLDLEEAQTSGPRTEEKVPEGTD